MAIALTLEDGVDERRHHRTVGEDQQGAHHHDRDDQRRQPVLLADPQEVPDVLGQIDQGFHCCRLWGQG